MRKYLSLLLFLSVLLVALGLLDTLRVAQTPQRPENKIVENNLPTTIPTIQEKPTLLSSERQKVQVERVIDGDTIEILGGLRVRYIGIDTPETVDPRKAAQCFGREAAEKNRELIEGRTIEMEKDVSETDKYGRLLRYIYFPSTGSGQAGDIFINDFLVRQGFARASTYPPDIKYQEQFRQAEKEARENNRGLWAVCGGGGEMEVVGEGCQIKGNISSSGEKIYHLPACPYWSKTVISEEKGERWFCSEEEAKGAGWRRAQNCQ